MGGREIPQSIHAKRSLSQNGSSPSTATSNRAFADLQCELDAVGETAFEFFAGDHAIDDDIQIVGFFPIQFDFVAEVDDVFVDACAHETVTTQAIDLEPQLAFARAADRREHAQTRSFRQRQNAIDDLLNGLGLDFFSAIRAMRNTDACEQEGA